MSKPRIAFICPSKSWGGLEMNVLRQSVWLNKRGKNILLYCSPNSELSSQAHKNSVEIRNLESSSKFKDLLQAKKLANSFKQENVRLVLFHLNCNFPMMSLTKLLSRSYFSLLYMQHMQLGGDKKDMMHSLIYKQLDCWIAPLNMYAGRLREISNIKETQIEVIPFGIELDRFIQCSLTQTDARQKLNLPTDKKIVGTIGRLDPKKCQHLLIEAAHKLQQKNIEIDLLLVGDSTKNEELHYKKRLEKMIVDYNLQERVHFRSHINDVETAFKALDIFCLTTGSETFGMVTIEAMASQLAVLGSNAGGTSEIIQHDKNGLLYQSGNSDEIALLIEKIFRDNEFKERLAKQACLDAQHNYSHTVQCDALEKCFDRLIEIDRSI